MVHTHLFRIWLSSIIDDLVRTLKLVLRLFISNLSSIEFRRTKSLCDVIMQKPNVQLCNMFENCIFRVIQFFVSTFPQNFNMALLLHMEM